MVTTRETAGQLSVRKVGKVFNQGLDSEMRALEYVDLDVAAGSFISLLGPSGCGKSTLLRLIAGLDTATSGSLALDGVAISGPHYLRGLVFQDPTLFPWRTIAQNIALGLDARGILAEKKGEISEYVKLVGLEGFEDYYPHQVSGGMAQRAALARALINHPKLLLLDEPLGALDAFTRVQMQEEILQIWQDRGTTMVFVTHDVDEAIFLSDRIAVMTPRPGRIHEIIEVTLARPRNRTMPEFIALRDRIMNIFNSHE